jgi:hypothetical protein
VEGPPSPRKRARFAGEDEEESEELSIALASELLGTMCVGLSLDSEKPVRRVSRRKSYDGDSYDGDSYDDDSYDGDVAPSPTLGLGDNLT